MLLIIRLGATVKHSGCHWRFIRQCHKYNALADKQPVAPELRFLLREQCFSGFSTDKVFIK